MFGRIHEHRALSPLLCGLIFIALWHNTIVWTFCPHLSTRSPHCLTEKSLPPSPIGSGSASMSDEHEHHGDMSMSDMDQEETVRENARTGESKTGNPSSADIRLFAAFDPRLSDAVTRSQESCSHCMMHSQSGGNSSSAPVVLNNSTSQGIVVIPPTIASASFASTLPFIDVQDHGPPGLNSSRYILNISFRI